VCRLQPGPVTAIIGRGSGAPTAASERPDDVGETTMTKVALLVVLAGLAVLVAGFALQTMVLSGLGTAVIGAGVVLFVTKGTGTRLDGELRDRR
jgi:hypothetical protein